ncbi:hypothetical protein AB1K83_06185 [Sporosarcina sp. 179-K 3D1 HS]|uniref:hypothetical protein n=1 Tax=Sporosarcina sp. 179-K 3D1 HS TaxID=3232169 RepID=UPI00399FCB60
MNDKGYSWPEAILTLTIAFVIFGTLLPFGAHMSFKLYEKKKTMHAMEVALKGAILYQAYGGMAGTIHIEDVSYDWKVSEEVVCVSYDHAGKVEMKCAG